MRVSNCRVCGCNFVGKPLVSYKDLPSCAQHLPDKKALKNDKGIDINLVQCLGCGLSQLTTGPVSYYREVIRAAGFSKEMTAFRANQFRDFVKKFSLKNKKIIEIGCGNGEYLSIMRRFCSKVCGVEYSLACVDACSKSGLNVTRGFVKCNTRIPGAPYDGFYTLNFLEHLPEPNSTLAGICENLSDGAVGLVEVPNFDLIVAKNMFSELMVDHLFYFTKDTLCRTLEFNGFDVLDCKVVWHDYVISAIVRKRSKLSLSGFNISRTKIIADIYDFIHRFRGQKIAVWGAGHQALAALAMFDLSKEISYVIDSAPFKQGKYTPVTHIPIVEPQRLLDQPVGAIIVMAASYSDEVVRIIRKDFSKKMGLAVLRDFGLEVVGE